jgi:hypothetical protein
MEKFSAVKNLISALHSKKIVNVPDAPILYWNFPEKGSLAYLHIIHKGLSSLEWLSWNRSFEIPTELIDFLSHFNGMSLYYGGFSIYGFRDPYTQFRNRNWLPYRLEQYELLDRPTGVASNIFIFGTANDSEQLLCYDKLSLQVHVVDKNSPAHSLRVFPSFEDFLTQAITTLEKRFLEHDPNLNLT